MSSMSSYTVGSIASKKRVFNDWLSYYQENEKKLLRELKWNWEFRIHRKRNILNKNKLVEIQKEFQTLYMSWRVETVSNNLRQSIISSMNQYILKLKVQLNDALDYEALQKERLRIKKEIEEQERLNREKKLRIKKEISEQARSIEEEIYEVIIPNVNSKIKTYIKEVDFMLERAKKYDQDFYARQKEKFEKLLDTSFEQKLKLFYDNLRLEYGKIKTNAIWTNVYKESLESFKTEEPINNDPDLMHSIDSLLEQKQISENMYDQLYAKIQEKITFFQENQTETLEADRIIAALEKLNYLVIDENKEQIVEKLSKQEKVEIPVKDKDYRVVVKYNHDDTLLTRFVRVVQDKKDIERLSASEKLQDTENLKKWCKHQKDFIQYLNHDDLELEQTIIEDDESEVLYIVDKNLKKETQFQTPTRKRGSSSE